jgi:(S)-ureidoglycine aminohydrolase
MRGIFGETRTRVSLRHALITPDGHVPSALPGFQGATPYFLITPAMGADLTQVMIRFAADGSAEFPADETETVLYVREGSCVVEIGGERRLLNAGGFAFCPSETRISFSEAAEGTEVTCFRKIFEPLAGWDSPPSLFGDANQVEGQPFLGNPRARLKVLIPPEDLRYDLAMNIFTYEPGATLPFVETHVMEHGLLMLEGQGIYRLEESYYPVQAGDVIWMAPHCPQWFVAMGDTPASYLYYKNVNRLT